MCCISSDFLYFSFAIKASIQLLLRISQHYTVYDTRCTISTSIPVEYIKTLFIVNDIISMNVNWIIYNKLNIKLIVDVDCNVIRNEIKRMLYYIFLLNRIAWTDDMYNDAVQINLITELSTGVEYAYHPHITSQLIIRNQNNEESQKVRVKIYSNHQPKSSSIVEMHSKKHKSRLN